MSKIKCQFSYKLSLIFCLKNNDTVGKLNFTAWTKLSQIKSINPFVKWIHMALDK